MKWLNETTGVIASCEQLRPVLNNGKLVRGEVKQDREFVPSETGKDILHEVVPGQVAYEDNDPVILQYMLARGKLPTEIVENKGK